MGVRNILTLRGARVWARYLDEAIEYFADAYDVAFASPHWPTWGHDNAVHLWEHPPVELAQRYVELAGGLEEARRRWVSP